MPSSARRRILCAESNKDVSDLIAHLLAKKGYEVESVQTAAECLHVASAAPFDLFVLNDAYIDADSVELCQQLRALYPTVPVLLFSLDGAGRHQPQQGVPTVGTEVYRSKTSDFVSLVQAIDRLMQTY
jgi:DNA-binding response OmpR family regulator